MRSVLFISKDIKRYSAIVSDFYASNINLDIIADFDAKIFKEIDFENYSLVILDYCEELAKNLDYINYYKINNGYTKYLILVNKIKRLRNINKYEMMLKDDIVSIHKELLKRLEKKNLEDNKKNIIIIDDDIISLEILSRLLEKDSYNINVYSDSELAFEEIKNMKSKNIRIDLLLVDLHMPIISGYKFIELLRESDKTRYIPIMIISSNSSKNSVEEVLKYYIEGYIIKPFNKKFLVEMINNFLDKNLI